MRGRPRIRGWIIGFLALVVVGCASGPRLTPLADSTHRFELNGFSILPPTGKDWFIVAPPGGLDRSMTGVLFSKGVGAMHTIGAGAKIYTPATPQTLEDLRAFVLDDARSNPRFKTVKAEVSLGRCLGSDCVRFELVFEDHAPRDVPGRVMMLTRQGFIVPHPLAPRSYFWTEYSQRFPVASKPYPVETELEGFLTSPLFTAVR